MTEARDALAVALQRSDEAHVHRADSCPACALFADAILAALPDGWVLARRQDAEDGAVLFEYAGPVYVRPVGRGIRLIEAPGGPYIDDVVEEGDYHMEVRITTAREALG